MYTPPKIYKTQANLTIFAHIPYLMLRGFKLYASFGVILNIIMVTKTIFFTDLYWNTAEKPRRMTKIQYFCICNILWDSLVWYGRFDIMHLSMVCPRMGGSGNPGELDFVKRTWVGILTARTIPGVGHLTWPPSWKVERIWEWVTSGAPSWNIPRIHVSKFSVSKSIVHCMEYCVASFKQKWFFLCPSVLCLYCSITYHISPSTLRRNIHTKALLDQNFLPTYMSLLDAALP